MFEQMHDPALATLRSPVWPIEGLVQLDHLGDHRREYLEYEGSISGGRGWVKRVESGEFTLSEVGKGEWNLRLLGPVEQHLVLRCTFDPSERWEAEPGA